MLTFSAQKTPMHLPLILALHKCNYTYIISVLMNIYTHTYICIINILMNACDKQTKRKNLYIDPLHDYQRHSTTHVKSINLPKTP